MLLGLVSCQNPSKVPSKTTPPTEESDHGNSEPEKPILEAEDLGNADGSPRDFTILARKGRYSYLYSEQDSSDRVESAAYKRNQKINDMFNVEIKLIPATEDKAAWWSNAVVSSSGQYDLIVPDYWWKIEQSGALENIMELNEINTSDSWWYSGWNNNATVCNKLYTIVGDAALETLENIEVVFFNKSRAAALDVDLYSIVNNGDWTMDEMLRYSKMAASNLDGANESAPKVYGALYDAHSAGAQVMASGIRLVQMNDDGIPELIANTQTNVNISDKIRAMIADESVFYIQKTARASANTNPGTFKDGNALFFCSSLYLGKNLKTSNLPFQYGIIPQPIYEKTQDYVSTIYGVSFFGIPKSVKNLHASAVILNAMNYLSNPKNEMGEDALTYQYFETVVMSQIALAPDDAAMLELIRNSLYVDFAFMYDKNLSVYSCFTQSATNNKSVITLLEEIEKALPENLADLIKIYQ